jgi:hypothetical protein
VTPAGISLDGTGIPITTASGVQYQPAVAFDGSSYLVSWTDFTADGTHIFGARVSRAGRVLDPAGLQISPAIGAQFDSAVAFAGGKFFVVWQDHRSGSAEIFGARVSRRGSVLDDAGIRISPTGGNQPAVASDGGNYLVVWTQVAADTRVLGARVSHAGKVVDPTGLPISTGPTFQSGPAVAFDGRTFLVVWNDFRSGSNLNDIFGARLSRSGTVLDPTGIPISTAAGDQRRPAVAFDGSTFLVVWEDRRPQVGQGAGIVGTRVSAGGIVQQPTGFPIADAPFDDQFDPLAPATAATTRDGTGVVYQRFAPQAPYGAVRVFLRTVSPQ